MRSPVEQRLSAAGFSPWIPLNRETQSMWVALGVSMSSGASMTYSVQQTMDDLHKMTQEFSISRTTTVATVTQTNHGLSVGDWVKVYNAGAPLDGEFSVASVTNANVFTYTVANSGVTSVAQGVANLHTARVVEHATMTGLTASGEGNYAFCPFATRFAITTYTSGFADFRVNQGRG